MTLSVMGRKIHRILINKAANHYSKKGYTILKEAKMSGRTRIDVLAIKDAERIGIECQLTISYKIIKEKFDSYGSTLTKMIFVIPAVREEKLKLVLDKISSEHKIKNGFFEIWKENLSVGTTLRISKKTRQLLDEVGKEIGAFGDSYDDIIYKALKKIEKKGDK